MRAHINYLLLWLWITVLNTFAAESGFAGFSVDYDTAEDYSLSSTPDKEARDEDVKLNKDFLDAIPFPHQIVYPVQMRMSEVLPNLDTRDPKAKTKNAHYHHTNLEIFMFDRRLKIRLDLNRELLATGVKQKHNRDENMQIVEALSPENCYYQGQIRKTSDSLVVVSTCRGIRGLILDSGNVFLIQPLRERTEANETRFPHVVIEMPPDSRASCGNVHGMWNSYKNLHQREFLGNVKIMKPQEDDAVEKLKFLNLGLVSDHAMFEHLNGTVSDALQYFILLANIMDGLLKDFRIRIRLVYVELWNQQDHFSVDKTARSMLTTFFQYRLETMTHTPFDFAHFLTGHELNEGNLGMAIPDSICSSRAVAISQVFDVQDLLQVAVGVIHMLGHSLGIEHDMIEECGCNNPYGCIMGQTLAGHLPDHAHMWSTCSNKNIRQSLLSRLGFCLSNESLLKPTFEQECGNGITERGEECDCNNREECDFTDPCCDPNTCLMKPWAMCRFGDCCSNCTVHPNNHMCRKESGECDVPEFCDGVSGDCPLNALVQDGQSCKNGESFCYHGKCHAYSSQCMNIWGEGAIVADDNCYEMFNVGGRFNGHCGRNVDTGEYLKCTMENIKCGLLHCANGTDTPINSQNKTFSITTIASQGNNYQCKIVNGLADSVHYGMVLDGTKCSSDGICIGLECVSLSRVMPAKCPVGLNGLVCSGHGKCTTDVRCFCSYDYMGLDCSQRSNRTFIPITQSMREPLPSTIRLTEFPLMVDNVTELTRARIPLLTQKSPTITQSDSTTMELIIALSAVVGGAIVVLAFCLFCYRRKSPVSSLRKKKSTKKSFNETVNLSRSSSPYSKPPNPSENPSNARSISFGYLPSYREDKRKKALRGGLSETDSERSRGDRDSTEIKAVQTLHLTKPPPEKGILKKHPRSTENSQRTKLRDLEKVGGKRESGLKAGLEVEEERQKNAENQEERALLQPEGGTSGGNADGFAAESRCTNCPADKWSSDDGLDFIDDGNEDDSSSSSVCFCGDDDKSTGDLDDEARPAVPPLTSSRSKLSQTGFVTAKVDEREMIRKNYLDLLEQFNKFDEQFNSVLSQTCISPASDLSTANSEHLWSKDNSKHGLLKQNEKGVLPQTELNSSSTADVRGKPSNGLPDLLHSGIRKSSPPSAEPAETTLRLQPQKQDEADLGQPESLRQKASTSSSMTLSNPLVKPLSQSTPPIPRTRLAPSPFTPFVPKTATSETFKKSVFVDDDTVASPLEMGATGGAKLDPISTVPYRGANSSGSPRLNRCKPGETDADQSRSDEDSKPTNSAFGPSVISLLSSSTNKQSINSTTNSEGCHSDRGNGSDKAIVIREISREFPFTPTSRNSSAKISVLLSSPEDIDV